MLVQSVTDRDPGAVGIGSAAWKGDALCLGSLRAKSAGSRRPAAVTWGTFSWAWVVRADGEVQYRLSHVDGRRERNPWRSVCRLTTVERRAIDTDLTRATDLLVRLAREHGHFPVDHRR